MPETMRDRYLEIDGNTPITQEHRADYEHLQACWEGDPDTLSVWQMWYLYLLGGYGAGDREETYDVQ